jgi:hypothetical protein
MPRYYGQNSGDQINSETYQHQGRHGLKSTVHLRVKGNFINDREIIQEDRDYGEIKEHLDKPASVSSENEIGDQANNARKPEGEKKLGRSVNTVGNCLRMCYQPGQEPKGP